MNSLFFAVFCLNDTRRIFFAAIAGRGTKFVMVIKGFQPCILLYSAICEAVRALDLSGAS